MKQILPKNRFIIFIIFTLLILAVGFLSFKYKGKYLDKNDQFKNDRDLSALDIASQSLKKDSDNDGLKDWEEILWKTDSNNPDTDGDGMSDGEEVQQGRDPLKPGPDDKLKEKMPTLNQGVAGADINSDDNSVNLTELFSRNLGLQTSDSINPLSLDNKNLLDKANNSTEKLLKDFISGFSPVIPESEFNISSDNSKIAIQKYDKELEKIFYDVPYPKKIEGEVFTEVAKTNNISLIDPYVDYYTKYIARMKQVAVPSSFINDHKRWVEYMEASLSVNESVKEIEIDPLKTIIAMQEDERIKSEFSVFIVRFANRISDLIK